MIYLIIKNKKYNPFSKANKIIMSSNGKVIVKVNNFKTKSGLVVEQRTIYPNNKENFESYVLAVAKNNNFISKTKKGNKKNKRSK